MTRIEKIWTGDIQKWQILLDLDWNLELIKVKFDYIIDCLLNRKSQEVLQRVLWILNPLLHIFKKLIDFLHINFL